MLLKRDMALSRRRAHGSEDQNVNIMQKFNLIAPAGFWPQRAKTRGGIYRSPRAYM